MTHSIAIRQKYLRASSPASVNEGSLVGAWACDLQSNRLTWSDEVFELFNVSRDRHPGREATAAMYAGQSRVLMEHHRQICVETGKGFQMDARIDLGNARFRTIRLTCGAFRSNGAITQILGTKQDITEEVLAINRLQDSVFTDALTGVGNRNVFDRCMEELKTGRMDDFHGVIVMDIDAFKQINDDLGHLCGDECLRVIGMRLNTYCADWAIITRPGGDEFVGFAFQPMTAECLAQRCAMLERQLSTPFVWEGRIVPVAVSIGMAVTDCAAPGLAYASADKQLYVVKAVRATNRNTASRAL